jgi:broad specificity phosphatase PhoE
MTDPTTRLFLCRHAEVEEKYHRVFGGSRIDMDLSDEGTEQAAKLGAYLARHTFDGIYVSPMLRAQRTLLPIREGRGVEPVTMTGLREVDFGDWTGHRWAEVLEKFQVSAFAWLDVMEKTGFPNGDSLSTLRGRVEPCLWEILENHRGKSACIVCHGGIVRMILSILLQMPLKTFASFDVEYAGVTEVAFSAAKVEVKLLNFVPWRDLVPEQVDRKD